MFRRIVFGIFAVLTVSSASLQAAQQIGITAHFADLPASEEVPATPDKLAKVKGANLLSSPRIVVLENVSGNIEVSQAAAVPGGGQVNLGVTLTVKTSITERGSIWFSGNLLDRSRGGGEKTERLETVGFVAREWYFSGYTPDGGTVVIRTSPATSQALREGKTVTSTRELVAYLKFEKVQAKAPAKKSTGPAKKTSAKSTPTKTRRGKR